MRGRHTALVLQRTRARPWTAQTPRGGVHGKASVALAHGEGEQARRDVAAGEWRRAHDMGTSSHTHPALLLRRNTDVLSFHRCHTSLARTHQLRTHTHKHTHTHTRAASHTLQVETRRLAALLAVNHAFTCCGEVLLGHAHPSFAERKETGFGDQTLDIRTAQLILHGHKLFQLDICIQIHTAGVEAEDVHLGLFIRHGEFDLAINTSRPNQSGIQGFDLVLETKGYV